MQWSFTSEHINDTIFFALYKPYTYSKLLDFINGLEPQNKEETLFKKKILCRSPGGLQVPLITIEDKSTRQRKSGAKIDGKDDYKHKVILVVARSHAIDSQSSYLME